MTQPAAEGPIAFAKHNLVKCFRDSASLPAFMNEPDATEAVKRIHLDRISVLPDGNESLTAHEMVSLRPYITVWTSRQNGLQIQSRSIGNEQYNGAINVYCEVNASQAIVRYPAIDPTSEADLNAWWDNAVGILMKEAYRAAESHLMLQETSNVSLWRCHPARAQTMGDYFAFLCKFRWGMRQ